MRALGLHIPSSLETSFILSTLDGEKIGLVQWDMFFVSLGYTLARKYYWSLFDARKCFWLITFSIFIYLIWKKVHQVANTKLY